MKIENFDLNKEVLVIAEIGNNHEGNFARAEEMIQKAAEAGAGAVKFQAVRAEHLIDKTNEARYKQIKSYELSNEQFVKLSEIARKIGVIFLVTPFDLPTVETLNKIVPAFKIASGDNNFYPLLEEVAGTGKPIILSTGLADIKQIKRSKAVIENIWQKKNFKQEMSILHCVCSYPVPIEEANLAAIQELKNKLKCTVGYSDHTLGIEAAVLSVALGARIIEKHFTLDKNLSAFRDHQLSADHKDLANLVKRVKEASILLGTGKKIPQTSECKNTNAVRRSIVAGKDLPAGTILRIEDLEWVRLAGGLQPGDEKKIIGKKLTCALKSGDLISLKQLSKKD